MPAARYFDPEADRVFAELQRNRDRVRQYQAQATPQQAQRISALHQAYPNLGAGVLFPAAESGLTPDSEEMRALAQAQEKRKEKKGLLAEIGDVVSAPIKAFKAVGGVQYDILKGVSRGTFAGPQFFKELADEGVRELVNPAQNFDLSSTTLGAGHDEITSNGGYLGLLTGKTDVDFGSGFFVGGNVKKRQVAGAREGGTTDSGKALTIGRQVATRVFDTETSRGYNVMSGLVDATLALALDPTTYVGGAVVKPAQAAKNLAGSTKVVPLNLADEAGLIQSSTRNTYLPEKAHDWLVKSTEGQKLREYLVNETNFERMRQATKGKLPVELVAKLTQATDDDSVLKALADEINIGGGIREKFKVGVLDRAEAADDASGFVDLGIRVRRRKRDARLWALLPGHEIDFENLDEAVEQLNRFQQNAKIGIDERAANNLALVKADSPEARYKAVRDVLGQVAGKIESELGGTARARDVAKTVTRAFDRQVEDSKFLADDLLRNAELAGARPQNGIVIDGQLIETASPHLWVEGLHRSFPLPDAREIRRVLTNPRMRALLDENNVLGRNVARFEDAADFFRDKVWVPAKLLRGAYMVRNLMEAQMSSAAGGYSTGFYHPIQYLGYVLYNPKGKELLQQELAAATKRKKIAAATNEALAKKVTPRGQTDALGRDFQQLSDDAQRKDAYGQALDKVGFAAFRTEDGKKIISSRDYIYYSKDADPKGFRQAWANRLSMLSNDPVAKRVVRGVYDGEAPEGLTGMDAVKEWFWSGAGQKFRKDLLHRDEALDTREGADAYVEWLERAANEITGGKQELLDLIRTGRLGGTALWNGDHVSPKALHALQDHMDAAPQQVSGPMMFASKERSDIWDRWDDTVNAAFQALAATPENTLSRSPIFRQAYWRRLAEMAEFLTPEDQAKALANARKSNVDPQILKTLQAATTRRSGEMVLDGADEVAKRHALHEVRNWLYTSHDKSQFFDITRHLFVFGDAWKNIFTRWARIGVTRPQVPYRVGRAVQEGRDADWDDDGRGLFFRDPTTGEERVAWPGSNMLLKQLAGVDASFDSSLKSLNMVTQSVIPGIGPTTSLPAQWFLPDEPEWDEIRNTLLPMGEADGLGVLPPFIEKALTAVNKNSVKRNEAYAATQMDVMRYLYSTGEYDLSDPTSVQDLLADAKKKTSRVFYLRSVAQFGLPAAPAPNFKLKVKNDQQADVAILSSRLRALQDEDFETATARFLEEFGESALLMLGSKTDNLGSAEPTKEAGDFARRNSDAVSKFKDVYGFFVGPGGAFDPDTYQAQRDRGERVTKTPEDFLADAEQRVAQTYYRQIRDAVGPNPGKMGQAILRQAREVLKKDFTHYNPARYEPGKVEDTISRLREAATDPVLGNTEAGQGLQKYLAVRGIVVEMASARGISGWGRAGAAEDLRHMLRFAAQKISSEHPDFADMFERALSREMVSDE